MCQVWLKLIHWSRGSGEFNDVFLLIRHISLLKWRGLTFEQLLFSSNKKCFVPSLFEIGPVILEEKSFKFLWCIFSIFYYLSLEKGVALYLNKLESHSPKNVLCQIWVGIAPVVLQKKILKILSMYFCYFIITCMSPWLIIWTKLNPHTQEKFVQIFYWNWPSGSGEKKWKYAAGQMDRQTTDNKQSEKLTGAFSSG